MRLFPLCAVPRPLTLGATLATLSLLACGDPGTSFGEPLLEDVTPRTLPLGASSATLSVKGADFTAESVVYWDDRRVPTVPESGSRLKATLDASYLQVEGPHRVSVYTPLGGGSLHSAGTMMVDVEVPTPVLDRITPDHTFVPPFPVSQAPPPEPTTSNIAITATGSGFNRTSRLVICCVIKPVPMEPSSVTPTQLIAAIPHGHLYNAGDYRLSVVNVKANGGQLSSATLPFEVRHRRPVVDSVSPSTFPLSSPPEVMIWGQHFVTGSVVHWDGEPVPTRYDWRNRFGNAEVLFAKISSVRPDSATRYTLTVVTPEPGGGESDPFYFDVPWGIVTITRTSPGSLQLGEPSTTTLQVYGDYFSTRVQGFWNGQPRPTVYIAQHRVDLTVNAQDQAVAGTGHITVVDPLTNDTSNAFPVDVRLRKLALFSASPSTLKLGEPSTTTLRVFGDNFVAGVQGYWNGQPRPTQFANVSQVNITVSPADQSVAGTGFITVVNPAISDTSNALPIPVG